MWMKVYWSMNSGTFAFFFPKETRKNNMEGVESQPMFSPSPIRGPRGSPRVGETHSVRDAENGDANQKDVTVKKLDINNVSDLDETQDMSTEFDNDPKNGMLFPFKRKGQ